MSESRSFLGVLSILWIALPAAAQGPTPFHNEVYLVLGAPEEAAAGDLNGDGRADLVVAGGGSGTMSVFLAAADGRLGPELAYGMGNEVRGIALADVNGDGKLDAITANASSATVGVRLGNGSGGFGSLASYAAAIGSMSLGIGDFDNDGDLDLAVANGSANTVSILRGTGSGSFTAAPTLSVAGQPVAIAVGDFDPDGALDLAIACQSAGRVTVMRGDGAGNFSGPIFVPTHTGPVGVSAADVDGDGKLDLAVANQTSNDFSFLLGLGNASFAAPVQMPLGTFAFAVRFADFDGDGKLDIVGRSTTQLHVFPGDGAGSFGPDVVRPLGSLTVGLALGDFDADGKLDAAGVMSTPVSAVEILLQDESEAPGNELTFANQAPFQVVFGDVNQDGQTDVVTLGSAVNQYPHSYVVFFGSAEGRLTYQNRVVLPEEPDFGVLVNLDADPYLDLVVLYGIGGTVRTYPGQAGGTFGPQSNSYPVANGSMHLATGDFNEDGKIDLAVCHSQSSPSWILFGNGTGGFVSPISPILPIASDRMRSADMNHDGHADLVASSSQGVAVLLGVGNGTFAAPLIYPVGTSALGIAVGDLDLDGNPDVVVSQNGNPHALLVLRGDGAGGLTQIQVVTDVGFFRSLDIGDFDGDGTADVLGGGGGTPWATFLRGDGTGQLAPARRFGTGGVSNDVFSARLDCDARLDMVTVTGFFAMVVVAHGLNHAPPSSTYCTAKTNSLGCVPAISSTGVARAAVATGFVVRGTNVRNNKPGLLFYGVSGQAAFPFQGGTLCVKSPIKRTPGVSSGGSPAPANDCSGVYSLDMSAFAHGLLGGTPLPALLTPRTIVQCQWWGRDPGFAAPNNTTLTEGLQYDVRI